MMLGFARRHGGLRPGPVEHARHPSLTTALKTLIEAETEGRRVWSIQYQMRIAQFPHSKDFATFDHGAATVTKTQIDPFCLCAPVSQSAHPGSGVTLLLMWRRRGRTASLDIAAPVHFSAACQMSRSIRF